jgi:DNA-binding response OmpR family regulator
VADSKEKKQIFIVEDDLDLADMLTTYFQAQEYEVRSAIRGEKAISQIKEELPDVIVLDIQLPGIDGYEVCRRLRRSRSTRHLPVIFLTERRKRDDKLAGLELGAVDYITKPFDIQELRLRIRNALRRAEFHNLHNPVTGLPEGPLVKERLEKLLQQPAWGIVLTTIRGLERFRDDYGFVAADDVTRAVSLMITNALQENDAIDDFIGHTGAVDFIIITDPGRCPKLAERCRLRLEPAVPYFYPVSDRERIDQLPESERLTIQVVCLSSRDGRYRSLDELGKALNERLAVNAD